MRETLCPHLWDIEYINKAIGRRNSQRAGWGKYTFNSSTWKAEAAGSESKASRGHMVPLRIEEGGVGGLAQW